MMMKKTLPGENMPTQTKRATLLPLMGPDASVLKLQQMQMEQAYQFARLSDNAQQRSRAKENQMAEALSL